MQQLLDKIGVLDYKYKILNEKEKFNIFSILRQPHDEVNLHSRFIAELLSPQGIHGQGNKFLKAFFEVLGIKSLENTEFKVSEGQIDILIEAENKSLAVIIENKIYAADQPQQLERYYKQVLASGYKDENIKIIYLTLDAHSPSDDSLGSLEEGKVSCISYKEDIIQWIDKCISIAALSPSLREALHQYSKLIKELTGQFLMADEFQDLLALMGSNPSNMVHASKIANSWMSLRKATESKFWDDLEKELKLAFPTSTILVPNDWKESLDNIYGTRYRNLWIGISVEIYKGEGYSYYLHIERGNQSIPYGIIPIWEDKNKKGLDSDMVEMAGLIADDCDWKHSNYWLGGHFLDPKIDFEHFTEETAKLLNNKHREEYIAKCIAQMKIFVEKCQSVLAKK